MKTTASFCSCLAVALLFVLSSAGIAAAQVNNTYYGSGALAADPTGTDADSAFGNDALYSNTTGEYNTAVGANALTTNTGGWSNTAVGDSALTANTGGQQNTATGEAALYSNTEGNGNTATGIATLFKNTTGEDNTAIGYSALAFNTTGSNNIGIGNSAGTSLTTGSSNIDIGDNGGVAGESDTIRIGAETMQTATYVAGIYREKVGKKHCPVLVDSDGRLGCGSSKTVDTSMLLNELQKQAAQMADMKVSMRRQAAELKASHARELAMRTTFEERLSSLEQATASKNGGRNLAAAFNR